MSPFNSVIISYSSFYRSAFFLRINKWRNISNRYRINMDFCGNVQCKFYPFASEMISFVHMCEMHDICWYYTITNCVIVLNFKLFKDSWHLELNFRNQPINLWGKKTKSSKRNFRFSLACIWGNLEKLSDFTQSFFNTIGFMYLF